ncbi:MAG: M23 family metallopeptidase [Oscillospiraceae bacterium]|nr:M23 family metallopeptidase [Oscillospiraceae bacterium]
MTSFKISVKNNVKLFVFVCFTAVISGGLFVNYAFLHNRGDNYGDILPVLESGGEYIKWMEFNLKLSTLQKALKYDIDSNSNGGETPLNWIELMSYAAAKNWGNVKDEKKINRDIDDLVKQLRNGKTIEELTENNNNLKLYGYYYETFYAVLNGFVGDYELIETSPENPGEEILTRKYGLKVFSPIARGYGYSHYDDFGNSRSFGYRRKHLGNDLLGSVGTPIIAVEDGYIEAMGWNRFGGWRIGIRSHDNQRYYYYAHLRKGHPFAGGLKEGGFVQAGDVIGYLGMTGYSSNEDTNNIQIPHLHFGLQIIFDESQKDGINQIWVDVYNIVKLLEGNRMAVGKTADGKEWQRARNINNIVTD